VVVSDGAWPRRGWEDSPAGVIDGRNSWVQNSRLDRAGFVGTGIDLWHQFMALYSKGDTAETAELMTDDVVQIQPTGRREGRWLVKAHLKEWDEVLSDMTMETSVMLEDGDVVVAEWNLGLTVTRPLPSLDGTEIAAAGRTLEYGGACVARRSATG
jgi:ketosteroid isomerase-like protein